MDGRDIGRLGLMAVGRAGGLALQIKVGAIVAVIMIIVLIIASAVTFGNIGGAVADEAECSRPGRPGDAGPRPGAPLREKQIANAKTIEAAVHKAGMPGYATFIAVLTAIGESDLINVDHGDEAGPDSRGLFQQRKSWGTEDERMNPEHAALSFLLGPNHDGKGGLAAVDGWMDMQPSEAAHTVQRNANPEHYTAYLDRLGEIATEAGLDFERAGDPHPRTGTSSSSATSGLPANPCEPGGKQNGSFEVGDGACPVDDAAPALTLAEQPSCTDALQFLANEMNDGSRDWYRLCLLLVETAYGVPPNGVPTAKAQGLILKRRGLLSTDTENIPRGAVLYWSNDGAGHVAIYDGQGHILSNDAPVNDGRIGRVPWDYPATIWGQDFMGWAPPVFPNS